jgi:putative membrane protein
MLVSGIIYHLAFMRGLRNLRAQLVAEGLVHGQSHFPVSMTLIVALLLLLLGLFAIAHMLFHFSI